MGIRGIANQNKQRKGMKRKKRKIKEFPTMSFVYSDISWKENPKQNTPAVGNSWR